MGIITQAEAAKLVGVSRQTINQASKNEKWKYPFFVYNKNTSALGVDTDSRHWSAWLANRENKPVTKKIKENKKPDVALFVEITLSIVQEKFGATDDEMEQIRIEISKKYSEKIKG